jgi:hypothetical protein
MGARHLVRLAVAAAIAASTACTIWAAIDDPYKSDNVSPGGAGGDAAPPANRLIDAGFSPYAITAMGDTVFVLDNQAQVHVAYDAGTRFELFWVNDAGETVTTQNRIAVSDAGVFWTVNKGIRYCALDGGACGLLPRPTTTPTAIAASDSMVAWIDTTGLPLGIGRCSTPVDQCKPAPIALNIAPASLAVTQDGTVAWVAESNVLHFENARGRSSVVLPQKADVVAADPAMNHFYWEGQGGIGLVQSDALVADAGYDGTYSPLSSGAPPNQLFAANGDVYWSIPTSSAIDPMFSNLYACRFEADGGCPPRDLGGAFLSRRVAQGVVATSRQVLAVLTSPVVMAQPPELLVWNSPFLSSK